VGWEVGVAAASVIVGLIDAGLLWVLCMVLTAFNARWL